MQNSKITVSSGLPKFQTCKKSTFAFIILSAIILISRWYYIENFAVPLPFWDQWDAEGANLLLPWVEGHFKFSDLWKPHNEHRIVPTRILALLCFKWSGYWNNLNEARLNIVIASAAPIFLIWIISRVTELRGFIWLVLIVITVGGSFPFGWENMLVGFQSQVYFLVLFAVLAMTLASVRPESMWAFTTVILLCILSILTMASGLLTPLGVAGVYGVNWYTNRSSRGRTAVFILMLISCAIVGYASIPYVPGHQMLRATSIDEFMKAITKVFSWPSRANGWAALPLWLPALIGIPSLLIRKNLGRIDILMIGCFLWTTAQALAIGYGRGHDLDQVTSRYSDLLTPGLISSSWFALRGVSTFNLPEFFRLFMTTVAVIFYVTFFRIQISRFRADMIDMKKHYQLSLIQTANVSSYLRTQDKAALDKRGFEIPYPNNDRLKLLLDNKVIREILPGSLYHADAK